MFTGISFLMAAITALVRGFRQTRQALAIAAAEECTLEEAARVGNSDRLIAIRGQVHPWPIPNPFTKPQPQTPVHPACHLLRACPYAPLTLASSACSLPSPKQPQGGKRFFYGG